MTEQTKEQIAAKAREFATAYTNRHFPNEPAFAFGNEGWAKFVEALVELAAPVGPAPVAKPRLIGWRTSDFLMETADKAMAQNWEVHHEMLPIFEGDSYTSLQAAPVAQLSEPPASAALMQILKIVQGYLPPNGTPINDAMSEIIACIDPWPGTGFTRFDDLLADAAEWSSYVEVDTAPYGLKRHLEEVFEKYGITAAAPTTPKD